jgi:RecA/RadA recombinase
MSDTKDVLAAFSKFNDLLDKKTKGHVKLKGFSDIDEFIPTGNYMLNALMSGSLFGGYPNARSVGIAGESGTGKTFLCMNAVREAQKKGYVTFYVDTEGALDTGDFEKFGVDLGLLKYVRLGIVSEVKFFINDLIKTAEENPGLKIMVVVDSLGMLETDKEVADLDKGKSANDMGLRAKELRSLFKSFTLDLSNLKIPFLFTNHISSSLDQYKPDGMGGGMGPVYSASVVLMLKKAPLRDEATNAKTGVICRATTDKNRLAKPDAIEMHISFLKGMNEFVGLHKLPFNFENCGIGRGNKFTEKEFSKLKPAEQSACIPFEISGEKFYFFPKETARNYISRHTGEAYPLRELFSEKVWTDDALKELDENLIRPMYKYSTAQDLLNEETNDLDHFSDDDSDSF